MTVFEKNNSNPPEELQDVNWFTPEFYQKNKDLINNIVEKNITNPLPINKIFVDESNTIVGVKFAVPDTTVNTPQKYQINIDWLQNLKIWYKDQSLGRDGSVLQHTITFDPKPEQLSKYTP
jgi:hypothetical protein